MEARLLDLELPVLGTGNNPRSVGLHLTTVIRDLMQKAGIAPEGPKWNRQSVFSAGFMWEEVLDSLWATVFSEALARLLGRKYHWYHIGEVELDGIVGTPDGLDVHAVWTLQEAKFTWKSIRNKPVDNWYYMTQIKSYCKMLGISEALLHVYYCCGDWKGSGPIYQPWYFTFQPHELEENWAMITNHATYMGSK